MCIIIDLFDMCVIRIATHHVLPLSLEQSPDLFKALLEQPAEPPGVGHVVV